MQAAIDGNRTKTIMAVSSDDGITPILVAVNETNHALKVDDDITGTGLDNQLAIRDDNRTTIMLALSSDDVS